MSLRSGNGVASEPPSQPLAQEGKSFCQRARSWSWIGLGAVLFLWILDFHFDVRARDFLFWLDPSIYYERATAISLGAWRQDFQLPSVFPYFIAPLLTIHGSIPGALWINVACSLLLAISVQLMCRPLQLKAPGCLIVAVVLASPVMIGLSRTLYSEMALTALIAFAYAIWFRTDQFRRGPQVGWFALVLAICLMTKPTAAMFFVGPCCFQVVLLIVRRQFSRFALLVGACLTALVVTAVVQFTLFQSAFVYYKHLSLPTAWAMRLIGPVDPMSWPSITYYFVELVKSDLFLAAPFLILSLRRRTESQRHDNSGSAHDVVLWLWLLVPLIMLIYPPMKEPRHAAPCVVPAVLLIFRGISALGTAYRRRTLTLALLLVCVTQYFLTTLQVMHTPYFTDAPLEHRRILDAMVDQAEHRHRIEPVLKRELSGPGVLHYWMYTTNFAISGFDRSEASAMAWQLMPGIVYDLDLLGVEPADAINIPFERYDDLFSYTHFNIYNAACRWPKRYVTLGRRQVIENAEFIILKRYTEARAAEEFPDHTLLAHISRSGGGVLILSKAQDMLSKYRYSYGRVFLDHMPIRALEAFQDFRVDLDSLCYDRFKTLFLSGQDTIPKKVMAGLPRGYEPGFDKRPMEWMRSAITEPENQLVVQGAYKQWVGNLRSNAKAR